MNAFVAIGSYVILLVIGLFLMICGLMSAIIIPNHMGLAGIDWIYLFLSLLGVFWGSAGTSLITIGLRKD